MPNSIPAQPASTEISTSTMRSYNKSSLLPRNAFERFGVLCGPIFIALISTLSASFMAITAYWLDRPHELTQDFDDFRFPRLRNPGPCLLLFSFTRSPTAKRWLAYVNSCLTLFYRPAFGVMMPNLFTIRTNLFDGPLFAQQLLD